MPALSEVIFLSQAWAEACIPRPTDAVISITDREAAEAGLNDGWLSVLRVSFDDVDPLEFPIEPGEQLVEMQEQEAERIAGFVRDNSSRAESIVDHCRYGQSRSAGVAKAIAHSFGLRFPADYEHANNFVYKLVFQALQRHGEA